MENDKLKSIKKFNLFMGMLHLVQAVFMLIVALQVEKVVNFKPMITSSFLEFDTLNMQLVTAPKEVFALPFGVLVAVFLFLSAFAHFIVSSPFFNKIYNKQLKKGMNHFRWYEYALSSSVMICLIAVLFGVYDIGALLLLFALNASMNLFGLLMEKINSYTQKIDWTAFIFGAIAGFVPWIVIVLFAFGNADPSQVPWFVYAIVGSYFIFFNLFPINMILQYKKIGKWANYLYGEKTYIVLSLVAKTVLAWLVFSGVMQP